jgi:transcriptional regulator with XRE-family HTH domain
MGRKRQGLVAGVPERHRDFAEHLGRVLNRSGATPSELAEQIGRSHIMVLQYLQGVHLPRLQDLPELARALKLNSAKDLIPDRW